MFKYQIYKLTKGGAESRAVLLEDILTSDVFGLMDYFPYDLLLKPFLEQVKLKNPKSDFPVPALKPVEFSFWENFGWPKNLPNLGRDFIEPDVVVEWTDLLLIVEAKFISPTDPEELLREFLVGFTKARPGQRIFLLLIDKNLSPPTVAYRSLSKKLTIPEYIQNRIRELNLSERFSPEQVSSTALWINWQTFYSLIERLIQGNVLDESEEISRAGKRILEDLLVILERKGIIPFEVLRLRDFEQYQTDLNPLGELGLMIRTSLSDLSDISIDLDVLDKIGLIVNDPVPFLSHLHLDVDVLTAVAVS